MKQRTKLILSVLFWGSLWGIVEATLGWVFHTVHFRGGSLLLYSFGIFCMLSAASQAGKGSGAIFSTAIVAAALKLLDLLMPNTFQGAIHPALYILMEGAIVAVIGTIFSFKPRLKSKLSTSVVSRLAVPMLVIAIIMQLWLG